MPGKPKIVVLMDWYLPGTKAGGPVRSVYSLIQLLKQDYHFYIITTNKDLGETSVYTDVLSDELIHKNGFSIYYYSQANLNSDNLVSLINQINPGLIYLNSFWSSQFSVKVVRLKNKAVLRQPLLLAPRGMLGKGALGLKAFKKQVYLSLAKLMGWYAHIPFHATQQQEEADIRKKFSGAKVYVAPNINSSPAKTNNAKKEINHLKLFYLSRIARVKNLHFAIEILKTVPAHIKIEYDIYGNLEDKAYWAECSALIKQLPENIRVIYKGELSFYEVSGTLVNYNALLMPTLNENFGHSIVESLLCGCLAIISDQTPWNDLEKNEAGYAIALNNTTGFTNALVELAHLNQQDFSQKSNKAINYISTRIDLKTTATQYKNMFNECIKN